MQNVAAALEEMRNPGREGPTKTRGRRQNAGRGRGQATDSHPRGARRWYPMRGDAQGRFLPLKPLTEPELTRGSFARESHAPGSAPAEWKKPRDMPK